MGAGTPSKRTHWAHWRSPLGRKETCERYVCRNGRGDAKTTPLLGASVELPGGQGKCEGCAGIGTGTP